MSKKKCLSEIAQDVIKEYRRLGSLKAVAATLQISESKVRKILITEREIEYERTAQAMALLKWEKPSRNCLLSRHIEEGIKQLPAVLEG